MSVNCCGRGSITSRRRFRNRVEVARALKGEKSAKSSNRGNWWNAGKEGSRLAPPANDGVLARRPEEVGV